MSRQLSFLKTQSLSFCFLLQVVFLFLCHSRNDRPDVCRCCFASPWLRRFGFWGTLGLVLRGTVAAEVPLLPALETLPFFHQGGSFFGR